METVDVSTVKARPESVPTQGRIVLYRLTAAQAEEVSRRRRAAMKHAQEPGRGEQRHVGNPVEEGDTFPMVIVRVWGLDATAGVNGQVLLDGCDVLWVTSVGVGDGPGTFSWPTRG